jgi:hypothetical protein
LLTHQNLEQKERLHGAISCPPLPVLIVSRFITHSDKFAVPYLLVQHNMLYMELRVQCCNFFKEQSLYIILVYTSNVIHEYNKDQQHLFVTFFNVVNVLQNTKESNLSLSGDIGLGAVRFSLLHYNQGQCKACLV